MDTFEVVSLKSEVFRIVLKKRLKAYNMELESKYNEQINSRDEETHILLSIDKCSVLCIGPKQKEYRPDI